MATLCCNKGYAQNQPGEFISKASSCFNDEIYGRCNRAYRLTLSGNINVPTEATDAFCDGPCFDETHHVLDCINDLLSDFVFFNRATVRDVRAVLNSGCSFTSNRRGDFNVPSYLRDETSGVGRVQRLIGWNLLWESSVYIISLGVLWVITELQNNPSYLIISALHRRNVEHPA
ncbi:unnamed protein product [Linum trigynum]|uniref:DUF7731 domain-containing protein n=1 Tax=Linum trigynum TaxID=586398 RepID=A0AAV2GBD6_9ROSI